MRATVRLTTAILLFPFAALWAVGSRMKWPFFSFSPTPGSPPRAWYDRGEVVLATLLGSLTVALVLGRTGAEVFSFTVSAILMGGFTAFVLRSSSRFVRWSVRPVKPPPGWIASRILRFLCRRHTYDLVYAPVLADMQFEYFEALRQPSRFKAEWTRVRGYMILLQHLGLQTIIGLIKTILTHTKLN